MQDSGLWEYLPGRWTEVDGTPVLGYPWVPPTPFRLKDWERYDVSRFVDPGCVAPEDGAVSVPISTRERRLATIADDFARLAEDRDLDRAVLLCHAPPYDTDLDRAALDGKMVDLSHRIETDVELAIITDKSAEGLEVIRHSTAHLLAHAVKELFPDAQVTIGPVIENGFYYDFSYKRPFTPEDLAAIATELRAGGLASDTPAAIVSSAFGETASVVRGTLATIAEQAVAAGIRPPSIVVVGAVAGLDLS